MKRLTIHIVSESDIITAGLSSLIASLNYPSVNINTDINYIDRAGDGELHLVVADAVSMPPGRIAAFRQQLPSGTNIIGLTWNYLPATYMSAFDDTLHVYSDASTLKAAIDKVMAGSGEDRDSTDELTPREKEIVVGVVKGLTNKEIAGQLNVSVNTVMTHRRNIASKLQIHSPAGLTIYAIVSKLVSIDEIKNGKI